MRGEILHYDPSQGVGFIAAEDGTRYMFSRNDLQQAQRVSKGLQIDFRPDGQNAREVFIVDPRGPAAQTTPALQPGMTPRINPQNASPAQQVSNAPSAGDLGLWGYFIYCCTTGYAKFSGRARRKEYWSFMLFSWIVILAATFAGFIVDGAIGRLDSGEVPFVGFVFGGIAFLFFILPNISATVRRFHDVGLSGWLYLLFFVLSFLYVGGIIIFVITVLPSQRHDNKWGGIPAGFRG